MNVYSKPFIKPSAVPSFGSNVKTDDFFGISSGKLNERGYDNLMTLKKIMQTHNGFVDLGRAFFDNDKTGKLKLSWGNDISLDSFKKSKLAFVTLFGNEFKHNSDKVSLNSHTIGLVINEKPNEKSIYKNNPEIIILDSLGSMEPKIQRVHQSLIDFLKQKFPDSNISVTKTPQQTDETLSCMNWTLENLQRAKAHLGRTDLVNSLPKLDDFSRILEKQKFLVQNASQFI